MKRGTGRFTMLSEQTSFDNSDFGKFRCITSSLHTLCNSSLARATRSLSLESSTKITARVAARYCVQEDRNDVCPPTSHLRDGREGEPEAISRIMMRPKRYSQVELQISVFVVLCTQETSRDTVQQDRRSMEEPSPSKQRSSPVFEPTVGAVATCVML